MKRRNDNHSPGPPKETAKGSKKIVVIIFYDVCRVYLPKLLLVLVKIIQVSCFRNYGFSSEAPREGELVPVIVAAILER